MWVWICGYNNGASAWADSYECRASSRKSVLTEEAAEKGLKAHQCRANHNQTNRLGHRFGEVRNIGRKRWQ